MWRCVLSTIPHASQRNNDAATATILRRLWNAMVREPLPGITARHGQDHAVLTTATGATLTGPPATDFTDEAPMVITQDGRHINTCDELLTHIAADPSKTAALQQQLRESTDNLRSARTVSTPHPHGHDLWATAIAHHPNPGVYFEQIVTTGHPVHPLARTRTGLTPAQTRQWAPEHRPTVPLVLARPRTSTRHHGTWPWHDTEHTPLLPLHPYQAHRYRNRIDVITTTPAAPLMSLRTLAPHNRPDIHVKTAVDIHMTSALRQISAAALHNGPILSRHITELDIPHFAVHTENAALTTLTDDNQPDPHLSAIVRTLPTTPHHTIPIPLAALAEPDPHTGRPLIATIIDAGNTSPISWWESCVPLLLTAPLTLAVHGIALEAHGQNTLLDIQKSHPHRLTYRDFGGVRADPAIGNLIGDIPEPNAQHRHTTLIAALYSTVLRQLVHALTHHYDIDPHTWWHPIIEHSDHLTRHHPTLHQQIFNTTWPLKATTAMRLATDTLHNQWTHIPNPIADAR